MGEKQMRAAFDSWLSAQNVPTWRFEPTHPHWPEQYGSHATEWQWRAWQAGYAASYAAGMAAAVEIVEQYPADSDVTDGIVAAIRAAQSRHDHAQGGKEPAK